VDSTLVDNHLKVEKVISISLDHLSGVGTVIATLFEHPKTIAYLRSEKEIVPYRGYPSKTKISIETLLSL